MTKELKYIRSNGNRMIMLHIPTMEDMQRVYNVFKDQKKISTTLDHLYTEWAKTKDKTVILFQDTGSTYYRAVSDSTYQSYISALVPLDEFYETYDFQTKLLKFGEALTKLETQLK